LYERGVAWMLPMGKRLSFYNVVDRMGWTLRRLMFGRLIGMAVEGVGTWLLLLAGGVPMAGLLGILTGLFAFLPNIGSIISGVLIVLVGFSAGTDAGLYAFFVYLVVQIVDGYLIVPMVAKRATDRASAGRADSVWCAVRNIGTVPGRPHRRDDQSVSGGTLEGAGRRARRGRYRCRGIEKGPETGPFQCR
jgi:hypothetical protein